MLIKIQTVLYNMWLQLLIIAILYTLYYYVYKPLKYWDKKGIKYVRPIPIFGNMLDFAIRRSSNTEVIEQIYKKHPNRRYLGFHNFTTPALMIKDPELIKAIMVKDFDTFPEHRFSLPSDVDPTWNNSLLAMQGNNRWHDLRSTLSPSFTSSKMKTIYTLMKECSDQFVQYFLSQYGETIEVDLKDVFGRFANDVIANTAFGVTCDSLSNPANEFYKSAKLLIDFSGIRGLVVFVSILCPAFSKIIRMPVIPTKVRDFFTHIVKNAIKLREDKKITRPDMLHLLIESRKGRFKVEDGADVPETGFSTVKESDYNHKESQQLYLTDEVITSQVLIFFFAGFDTVSTMMSYMMYELALNDEVQKRLRNEIDATFESVRDELTYDALMKMKYLDMVVSETLRKWPPFTENDRKSVKPYVIKAQHPEEVDLYLEPDSLIHFPTYAIHRDPKYYPNPEIFDPERFNDKNKLKINPYAYFPFGLGPRNCIGSRFALMEAKLVATEIVKNFDIVVIPKTPIPVVFSKKNVSPLPDEGIWVGLKKRNV